MKALKRNALKTALAAAALMASLALAGSSGAQSGPVVSVDAVSDASNTATTLGNIDTCRGAATGSPFTVDVVIQGVTGITGLEGHLIYNASVLRVTGVSYAFLIGSAGGARIELGDVVPDTDGDFKMGVVTFPLTSASGSGVLVHLTLEGMSAGSSLLDLQSIKLSDALADPIQPADPLTGAFTGSVNDAAAVVGGTCADTDGDGYPDSDEAWVGTDPLDNCGNPTSTTPVHSQAWPADLNALGSSANEINLNDIATFVAPIRYFNSSPGPGSPFNIRWDLVPGKGGSAYDINLQDISSLVTVKPVMFGGASRAFNGPTCAP